MSSYNSAKVCSARSSTTDTANALYGDGRTAADLTEEDGRATHRAMYDSFWGKIEEKGGTRAELLPIRMKSIFSLI